MSHLHAQGDGPVSQYAYSLPLCRGAFCATSLQKRIGLRVVVVWRFSSKKGEFDVSRRPDSDSLYC